MSHEDSLANVKALREAVDLSPDNLPLRTLYVDALLKAGIRDEALVELKVLVKSQPDNIRFRTQLAELYLERLETSKGIVLIEDLVKADAAPPETVSIYVELLIEEERLDAAAKVYRNLILDNPSCHNPGIEASLGNALEKTPQPATLDEFPEEGPVVAEKPKIKFADVGGMAHVKEEISFKIIRPLQHKALFAAYGKKAGGGILLFGPPGCGKTLIARATAGETNSSFISIGIHEILSMWIGGSEHNLHGVFDYARRNIPAVLFFDEVDALGASRTDMKASAGRHVINQFLMELDGDKYSNEGILILAATNAPWHLDPAFVRPGRFDRIIFVPPPDHDARVAILQLLLKDKPTEGIDYSDLAKKTEGFSGADLAALVDVALEAVLREILHSNKEIPLTSNDLVKATRTVKPSTREWFATAKNYVVYSNESGLYDDVAKYLKMNK